MRLKGKTAIITASGRGIGREVALAKRGDTKLIEGDDEALPSLEGNDDSVLSLEGE